MQTLRIALRNCARQRKRTAMLAGAIAFGGLVVIMMGSFANGLLANSRANLSDFFGGQIYIRGQTLSESGRPLDLIAERGRLEQALASLGDQITDYRLRSASRGTAVFAGQAAALNVEGLDWSTEPELVTRLSSAGSRPAANSIFLPEGVAAQLQVKPGETLLFRLSTVNGQVNVGEFRVAGVYAQNQEFGVASAYADLAYLNGLIGLPEGAFQSASVGVRDFPEIDAVAAALHLALAASGPVAPRSRGGDDPFSQLRGMMDAGPGSDEETDTHWDGTRYSLTTLNELMAPLLSIIGTIEAVRTAVLALLLLIIMVGILNSFRMVLLERTQEIGALRAIGMLRRQIQSMFLGEALAIGILGGFGAVSAALPLMALLSRLPLGKANALQLFTDQGRFSLPLDPAGIGLTVLILAASSLVAAFLPARQAARLHPADALRSTH